MLCCSRKNHSQRQTLQEMTYLVNNTRFNQNDLTELKTRFNRMAKNMNFITKIQFRDNMGLLGLGTTLYLSDRIFDVMDDDRDGKIRFSDFAFYFDKVSNGDANEKAEISFKLIDKNRNGCFTFTEFINTMEGIINSWSTLTGQQISLDLKKQLEQRIKQIFDTMDINRDGKISLIQYQQSISKDPNLLEIFDFIKQGLQNNNSFQINREEIYRERLIKLEKTLEDLVEYMKRLDETDGDLHEIKLERYSSSFKKQITIESQFVQPEDRHSLGQQQRSLPLEQFHPSPIESILHFPAANTLNAVQNQQYNYPSFQRAFSNESSQQVTQKLLTLSPFSLPEYEEQFKGDIFQNENQPYNKKPNFQKIKEIEIYDEVLPNEDDFEEITKPKQKNQVLRLPLQTDDVENLLGQINEEQLKIKYKSVANLLKCLCDEIKQLKLLIEDEKFLREKQELKHNLQNLETIKANTAAKVHKQHFEKKVKLHKKPKISVSFGHENFNLVLNMMMGIQMAVNSINMSDDYEISQNDYKLKYYFELLPRRATSDKSTFKVCQFFDYAPRVFNSIRIIHKIDNQDYLKSIGPETLLQSLLKGDLSTLQELTSTGKSGSFFYYTADGRFTLKTIHHQEFRFLKKILKPYYQHIKANQDSLIIKLFGMHKIGIKYSTLKTQKVIYFVIMSNIFSTSQEINQRYDLKGSLYKRITLDTDPTIAMKDLNFLQNKVIFNLEPEKKMAFISQLEKDCEFFQANNVIDYSLLVGIQKRQINNDSSTFSEQVYVDTVQILQSIDKSEIYYFGIIDILTDFSTKKRLEYLSKRIIYGPTISAIPPYDYSQRFFQFIFQSIMKTK